MTWFATDNGPEENCPPEVSSIFFLHSYFLSSANKFQTQLERILWRLSWFARFGDGADLGFACFQGICQGTEERPLEGPGSSGPLRGESGQAWTSGVP